MYQKLPFLNRSAVDLLGDMICHSRVDPEDMEKERRVILQEIGQAADTPDDIIFDHFQATAYPDQALGRPVLGTAEIVGGMRRDRGHRFGYPIARPRPGDGHYLCPHDGRPVHALQLRGAGCR